LLHAQWAARSDPAWVSEKRELPTMRRNTSLGWIRLLASAPIAVQRFLKRAASRTLMANKNETQRTKEQLC
jgi:hypothetical protein